VSSIGCNNSRLGLLAWDVNARRKIRRTAGGQGDEPAEMTVAERFAQYALGTGFEDLWDAAVARSKVFILDSLAVGIAGSSVEGGGTYCAPPALGAIGGRLRSRGGRRPVC
jgi:hypothetical protein